MPAARPGRRWAVGGLLWYFRTLHLLSQGFPQGALRGRAVLCVAFMLLEVRVLCLLCGVFLSLSGALRLPLLLSLFSCALCLLPPRLCCVFDLYDCCCECGG